MKVTNSKFSNLNLASENVRTDNFIIDLVYSSVIGVVFIFCYPNFKGVFFRENSFLIPFLVFYLTRLLYYVLTEHFLGQTLGQMHTQTQVVNTNGKKPSFNKLFLRSFCRFFSLPSAITDDEVAIHDNVSKTFVIININLKQINTKKYLIIFFFVLVILFSSNQLITAFSFKWFFGFTLLLSVVLLYNYLKSFRK